jgi:signal peptide peptidase SppA
VITVIPIAGFIEQRTSFFGALFGSTSTQRLSAQFRASMADPNVKAIVFDVSSGGGSVFGVTELANEIMAARGQKPIVSVVNSMAASAAYWLAAAADEIVAAPSGIAGSVGVYAIHQDFSEADAKAGIKTEIISAGEHKADAVDGAPLSDEGRQSMQEMVDHIYGMFIADLAAGRKVSPEKVRSDFGKGLIMTAPAAKSAGMVDRIGTLDSTLTRLATPQGRSAVLRADFSWSIEQEVHAYDGEADRRLRAMAIDEISGS